MGALFNVSSILTLGASVAGGGYYLFEKSKLPSLPIVQLQDQNSPDSTADSAGEQLPDLGDDIKDYVGFDGDEEPLQGEEDETAEAPVPNFSGTIVFWREDKESFKASLLDNDEYSVAWTKSAEVKSPFITVSTYPGKYSKEIYRQKLDEFVEKYLSGAKTVRDLQARFADSKAVTAIKEIIEDSRWKGLSESLRNASDLLYEDGE
ncbi:hypothetical protein MHLP_01700 [Candidatus Mycoplasma haematolamae str. Purdue]|uniref:Uncharacterized protein n=1 Tax=Mycoplasma haematolamae (strain Purdue) TaxID=1212765 RepID=I7B9G8_MYCHA|nr:hypothetical protein [Candidatus Mycoplasma haematolamae]AFO51920.1 hypothetical protein MHLP_01700 [Candidatus Mycoplasma haematolamae str. Purdue]